MSDKRQPLDEEGGSLREDGEDSKGTGETVRSDDEIQGGNDETGIDEKRSSQCVTEPTPSMSGGGPHRDNLHSNHVSNVSTAVLSVTRVEDTTLCGDQAVCEDDHAPSSQSRNSQADDDTSNDRGGDDAGVTIPKERCQH